MYYLFLLCVLPVAPLASRSIFFSVGFTDDVVLSSKGSAVHGLVLPVSSARAPVVSVSLTASDSTQPLSTFPAVVGFQQGEGGTACHQQCLNAGMNCSVGAISGDGPTSCPYGCIFAQSSSSFDECAALCSTVHCGDTWEGYPLSCGSCATESVRRTSGDPVDLCRAGCAFVHNATAKAMSWKVVLPKIPSVGSFNLAVACTSGCEDEGPITLARVRFGLVFYCAGQSNMVLNLQQTYEWGNNSMLLRQVANGAYDNIHMYNFNSGKYPIPYASRLAFSTQFASMDSLGGAWLNATYAARLDDPASNSPPFSTFRTFSAACFYFASKLTDLVSEEGGTPPPIGLLLASMGGTTIESWSPNETVRSCADTNPGSSGAPVSKIFYGSVAPFVNTSLDGFVWYQGENNCGGVMGSPLDGTGYACSLQAMVRDWRRYWSGGAPGTTDPLAPFGVYTIHPSGCEGSNQIGKIRWAQTANVGHAPNPFLPNVYVSQLFDLGDPWANGNSWQGNAGCEEVNSTGQFGPTCAPFDDSRWDASLRYVAPLTYNSTVKMYMGGLHPRLKSPPAKRLALAYHNLFGGGSGPYTGPTLAGCSLRPSSNSSGSAPSTIAIEVRYNASLLRGETVSVSPYDADMRTWGIGDSPTFMVCLVPEGSLALVEGGCNQWFAMSAEALGPSTVLVTLQPPFQALPVALRYGWPLQDLDCCPQEIYANGSAECPAAACPIKGAKSLLPGNPFFANISATGSCVCTPPQVCDF